MKRRNRVKRGTKREPTARDKEEEWELEDSRKFDNEMLAEFYCKGNKRMKGLLKSYIRTLVCGMLGSKKAL